MTRQQKRLRRENFCGDEYVHFSEKTCDNKKIKLEYYGTIQDLYDYEELKYDYEELKEEE